MMHLCNMWKARRGGLSIFLLHFICFVCFWIEMHVALPGVEQILRPRSSRAVKNGTDPCRLMLPEGSQGVNCEASQTTFSNCPSFPSRPRNVAVKDIFQKMTKKLQLQISWNAPEFGSSGHIGYEVEIYIPEGHYHKGCWQLNHKIQSYTVQEAVLSKTYKISIISLPRGKNISYYSTTVLHKTPETCEFHKRHNLTKPFECHQVENLHVEKQCQNGSIVVKWNKPSANVKFEEYYVYYRESSSEDYDSLTVNRYENEPSVRLNDLKENQSYDIAVVLVNDTLGLKSTSKIANITFHCAEATPALRKAPKKQTKSVSSMTFILGMMGLAVVVVLAVAIAVIVYFRKAVKSHDEDIRLIPSASSQSRSVLLVYCRGCKFVERLTLLLASIFHKQGITVHLDLLEQNEVNQVGLAYFLETYHKQVDFVLFLCTQKLDSMLLCHNDFKFMVDLSRNAKLQNSMSKAQNIAVHLKGNPSALSSYVPSYLQQMCFHCHDQLETMISNIFGISTIALQDDSVVHQSVVIEGNSKKTLENLIKQVIKSQHDCCSNASCSKGQMQAASLSAAPSESSLQSYQSNEEQV